MKKIFALVLSLCLVCSSFVAVSAFEEVYNEGVYNDGIYTEGTPFTVSTASAGYDFEDGVDSMFVGNASVTATPVAVDGRNALKIDYPATADHSGLIGFAFKNPNGETVDLYGSGSVFSAFAEISWSIDVRMDDITSADPVLVLRDGTNPPSGQSVAIKNLKTEANGEWVTYSGTNKISSLGWAGNDAAWTNLTVRFYPKAAGTMYIDNITATVTDKAYYDVIGAESKSLATEGLEYGPAVSSVSYADGYATATLGGTGNTSMIGTWLRNTDGTKYVPVAGDKIIWSIDVNPSQDFAMTNGTARGVLLRTGGDGAASNLQPSGNFARLSADLATAPANTWTTLSGTFAVPSTGFTPSGWTGITLRPEWTGDLKVKNLSYSIRRDATTVVEPGWIVEPGWEVEAGWYAPDYGIPFTTAKAHTKIVENGNGSFTANMSDISSVTPSTNINDTTCYVRIIPTTPIALGDDWTITIDATSLGLADPDGVAGVKLRLFDNLNGTTMGNTLGWVTAPAATTTDGTITMVFDSANYSKAGNSTADTIQSVCLCYNFAEMYGATTGSVTFDNITFTSPDAKVTLAADKTANGIELTLGNAHADKYRFAGRLLIAEYKTVDGIKELIQFAETEVSEEIAAGTDEVVPLTFGRNITSGNDVYVFVWEPASFNPITTFVK